MDEQPRDPPSPLEPNQPAGPVMPAPQPAQPAAGWVPPPSEPEPTPGWIPPADGKPRRILIRVAAGIAVAVLGFLVLGIFLGSQVDPYDAALRERGQRLQGLPEFEARFGEVESEEEAFLLGQQVGLPGLARLPDDDLLRYWELSESMLAIADDRVCAGIMRQAVDASDATALARRLSIDEFREVLDINLGAMEAELSDRPGPPPPSAADIEAASLALVEVVGAQKLQEIGAGLNNLDDAVVCADARTFIGAVLDLREPHRTTLLRGMVNYQGG